MFLKMAESVQILNQNKNIFYEVTIMNNETIKRFDITIKLRGDNVYDLYMDGKWVASRGSCENIVDEAKDVIRRSLLEE